jgi:hypothetical protein
MSFITFFFIYNLIIENEGFELKNCLKFCGGKKKKKLVYGDEAYTSFLSKNNTKRINYQKKKKKYQEDFMQFNFPM